MTEYKTWFDSYDELLATLDLIAESDDPEESSNDWWDAINLSSRGEYPQLQAVVLSLIPDKIRRLSEAFKDAVEEGYYCVIPFVSRSGEVFMDFQLNEWDYDCIDPERIDNLDAWFENVKQMFFGDYRQDEVVQAEVVLRLFRGEPDLYDFVYIALGEDPLVAIFGEQGYDPDSLLEAWESGVDIPDLLGEW